MPSWAGGAAGLGVMASPAAVAATPGTAGSPERRGSPVRAAWTAAMAPAARPDGRVFNGAGQFITAKSAAARLVGRAAPAPGRAQGQGGHTCREGRAAGVGF